MASNLLQELQETIKQESTKFNGEEKLQEFEEAINIYKKLIEKGLTKKRGYNLLTIDKAHLKQNCAFNVSK